MREKGQGTIYEKNGGWVARLRFTDELGRPREKTLGAPTEKEAKAKLKQFRKEHAEGTAKLERDLTIGQLLDRLMAEVYAPKLRTNTLAQYEGLIRNHLRPLRDIRLSKLTVDVLEELLRDESKGRRTRGVLRRFLITSINHAVRLGLVKENVARRTLPVGGEAKVVEGLRAEEVRAILDRTRNATYRAAFRTQVELGLRVGETLGILWSDVDFNKRTVSIRQQVQRDRKLDELVLAPLKTAKSRRVLPLSEGLLEELRRLERGSVFVFPSEAGGPIEPRNYNRLLAESAKKAGLEQVSSHRLRHSYASWSLGLGVDIAVISRSLGHSQISTTMRYAAASTEVIRVGNERLSKLLDAG